MARVIINDSVKEVQCSASNEGRKAGGLTNVLVCWLVVLVLVLVLRRMDWDVSGER